MLKFLNLCSFRNGYRQLEEGIKNGFSCINEPEFFILHKKRSKAHSRESGDGNNVQHSRGATREWP